MKRLIRPGRNSPFPAGRVGRQSLSSVRTHPHIGVEITRSPGASVAASMDEGP